MLVPTSVCKMSHTTDSIDELFCKDQAGSPLMDECNSGGLILKKGPWTPAEDAILVDYVKKHGEGNWNAVQKHSGLFRCGKSCRLRWANHLRPNLKKGAFTKEEERLIVELHAKMGNKWARLAAHLPGRTDNEIKNYWNTRIKRRQRAGLPLYPPEMCLQESQHTGGGGNRGHHILLQSDRYEMAEVSFEANQGVLPYVSSSSMLMNHIASPQYSTFGHRLKRLRDSSSIFSDYRNGFLPFDHCEDDKSAHSCGLPFQVDSNNNNPLSFGVIEGGQSLPNGNFSASKPTSEEAVKLELPSLQYSETALSSLGVSYSPAPLLDSVDAFIQSPPSGTPRNSGLLDALLHEAKTLGSAKNHSSEKSKSSNSSSATPGDENLAEWEDYGDPISPLGHSATSLFSDISATGSSFDEQPLNGFIGCNMKPEPGGVTWPSGRQNEISTRLGFTRPDTLLAFDWFNQSVRDQSIMSDAIASLLSDDLGSEYKHLVMGNSNEGQGWGFGSCAWNNMPPVCQMSEIP